MFGFIHSHTTGLPVLDTQSDFMRARRAYRFARVRAWLRRCGSCRWLRSLSPAALLAGGPTRLEVVPLHAVVGTVDATVNFDAKFRPASNALRHRWERVALAYRKVDALPPIVLRRQLWQLIRDTPHLDWMLLTKRPLNIRKMLPPRFPWPNIWLGTTTENREEAARRIPHLQAVPAAIRFLSCEPLLEEVLPDLSGIHWVICGGESHPGKRLMQPEWARSLKLLCQERGVAFFMKQMTRRAPIPDDLFVRQWPPAAASATPRP